MTTQQIDDDKESLKKEINSFFAETPEFNLNSSQLSILDAFLKHTANIHRIKSAVVIVEYIDSPDDDLREFEMDYCGGLNISYGLINRAKTLFNRLLEESHYDRS